MNTKYIATLAAMLAVPALVVSCDGQNYSTPEGFIKGEIKLMKDFAEAAKACDKDNIAGFESAIKGLTDTQNLINKGLEAMTPEQKAEIKKLGEGQYADEMQKAGGALQDAMGALAEKLGIEGVEKLKPALEAFEKALEPLFAME